MGVPPAARIVAACGALFFGVVVVFANLHRPLREPAALPPPTLAVQPARLIADGYDTALLTINTGAAGAPRIAVSGAPGVRADKISGGDGKWNVRIRAGVTPGAAEIHVSFAGGDPASLPLDLVLDARDSAEDGTPDFLRLEDDRDRQAFRQWFTYLAEAQYFQPAEARPAEINDCAALIRYAYREALVPHDGAWAASARLPLIPAFDSSAKYQYPYTALGPALFRTRIGPFRAADLADGTFLQFADARSLWRYNAHFVSMDLARARPGDLLFFRQRAGHEPFHSMIYLGSSQMRPDGKRYVLYHTGPDGGDPGEIKRLTIQELMDFPQPEWRPSPSNPAFLGVARWNILRRNVE